MTQSQREASLSRDQHLVDQKLGQHRLERRYPKPVQIMQTEDTRGNKDVIRGFVLQPCNDQHTNIETGLENTTLCRDGSYVNALAPVTYINPSKKSAMMIRRDLQDKGYFKLNTVPAISQVLNKRLRTQFGPEPWECLITDCASKCTRPVLLINDIIGQVGDLGRTALRVKFGPEAARTTRTTKTTTTTNNNNNNHHLQQQEQQ